MFHINLLPKNYNGTSQSFPCHEIIHSLFENESMFGIFIFGPNQSAKMPCKKYT